MFFFSYAPCIVYAHLKNITAIWYTLGSFGSFVAIGYIFPRFVIMYQEKSGIPASAEPALYVLAKLGRRARIQNKNCHLHCDCAER
jgi:hypothetical protein